ncbi:multiprotein-bridging factor 1 family protein [Kribbella sp. NPDC051587]|uniref:multiprotein-bridging factor 1 family protein n=1 Tax=Kribbella sp. NPDC051587 TaxID=3364119 RepID=UPI0037B92C32
MPRNVESVEPGTDEALFAENMRRRREELGWSQGELARKMQDAGWENFHQTTVSRIEKGERPIRLNEARGLAGVMDAAVAEMLRPPAEAELTTRLRSRTNVVRGRVARVRRDMLHLAGWVDRLQESVDLALASGVEPTEGAEFTDYAENLAGYRLREAIDALDSARSTLELLAATSHGEGPEGQDG